MLWLHKSIGREYVAIDSVCVRDYVFDICMSKLCSQTQNVYLIIHSNYLWIDIGISTLTVASNFVLEITLVQTCHRMQYEIRLKHI